jgi:hypothetical protein
LRAINQAGLKLSDDHSEQTRREKSGAERTRRISTNGRELSQSGSDRRGHRAKLPADLFFDCARAFGGGQTRCFGGIGGGAQGVRAHMRNSGGLARRSRGRRRRRSSHVASSATSKKSATDSFGGTKLATSEGARPRDRIARTAIPRRFRLEQTQHALRAIRRPCCDDPPISLAQRLR